MRFVLLAALLLVGPAAAQMDLDQTYQVRAAFGDIDTTPALEADGLWNVAQELSITNATEARMPVPSGGANVEHACDCNYSAAQVGDEVVFTFDNATTARLTLTTQHPYMEGAGFALTTPSDDAAIVLHVPAGAFVQTSTLWDAGFPIGSTDGMGDIYLSTTAEGTIWFAVKEAAVIPPSAEPMQINPAVWVLGGVIAGVALWAVLVQQGMVQKRTRKQVAGTSAYHEAAKEGKATLEGRKRALMAALKELELAKMNKELDTGAYDALKADFKKQAVTVMRALEGAQ